MNGKMEQFHFMSYKLTLSLDGKWTILELDDNFLTLLKNEINIGDSIQSSVIEQDFFRKLEQQLKDSDMVEAEWNINTGSQKLSLMITGHKIIWKNGTEALSAVCFDITEWKNKYFMLQREMEHLDLIVRVSGVVIFDYNKENDSIIFSNKEKLKNLYSNIITSFTTKIKNTAYIDERDKDGVEEFFRRAKGGKVEFRYKCKKNKTVWYEIEGEVVRDPENGDEILTGCIRNIDIQKKKHEQQLIQSSVDSLTGVLNKKYIREQIEEYLAKKGKDGKHVFMIADVDNFWDINEKMGKLFGDTVLSNIADCLKNVFGQGALIGRIGGDKFLIFLKNIKSIEKLEEKLHKVRESISYTYIGENVDRKATCSLGITWYPKDAGSYESLFKLADLALYHAKRSGKDCWMYYNVQMKSMLKRPGYFQKYSIKESPLISGEEFDKEMNIFAFNIMTKTKDVNSAINLVLEKLGRKMGVDHVSIMENTSDNKKLKMSYLWDKSHDDNLTDNMELEYKDFNEFLKKFGSDDIALFNDSKESLLSYFKQPNFLQESKTKSIIQCAIFENGKFEGCICMDDCSSFRHWTQAEADTLIKMTRMLSSYLLKIHLSEQIQSQMDQIKNYDSLTGLPTLYNFKKIAKQVLEENTGQQYAVVYSDISNFKYINDTLGYEEGDRVLCDFASLIQQRDMLNRAVCRVSSDNFMALMPYYGKEMLCDRVFCVNEQFGREQKSKNPGNNLVIISGAAVINPKEDVMVAIDNANLARKSVKGASKTVCKFYSHKLTEQINKEIAIAGCMEKALRNGEFHTYLQPKVELKTGRIAGAEALVRWIKEDGSIMPPDEFIPLFEKNGFVVNLDFYIYEEVCKLLDRWLKNGMPVVPLSVNVSRVHLYDDNFIPLLRALVDEFHIPYSFLELELTESIFLDNTDSALDIMKDLRRLGFGVSIDDFGAGYSSLNLLKDFTIDVLKLDKEFLCRGEMKKEEKIIVSSIIGMAKKLDMKVLSEGVETENQSDFLKKVSCDLAQGYLYAKPMPIEEFETLLAKQSFM